MSCLSKVIKTIFGEKKFACSQTKSRAIVQNVFHPMITKSINNELNKIRFICISTDAPNHESIKLFPIIFRYYIPLEGIRTPLVDLVSMSSETAQEIRNMLLKVLDNLKYQATTASHFGNDNLW